MGIFKNYTPYLVVGKSVFICFVTVNMILVLSNSTQVTDDDIEPQ